MRERLGISSQLVLFLYLVSKIHQSNLIRKYRD